MAPSNPAPAVTVMMPAFNGEAHIESGISSVLGQTFEDFELIIVDDGSTDRTADIAAHHAAGDRRVRLLRNDRNLGTSRATNRAIDEARGRYVAQADHDDVLLPERLERQVSYLDATPDVGVLGGAVRPLRDDELGDPWIAPAEHESIRLAMMFSSAIYNPSVMMRRSVLERHRLRLNPARPAAVDYDLFTRMLRVTRAHNLGDVLVHYRIHDAQVSTRLRDVQVREGDLIARAHIEAVTGRVEDGLTLEQVIALRRWYAHGQPTDLVPRKLSPLRVLETFVRGLRQEDGIREPVLEAAADRHARRMLVDHGDRDLLHLVGPGGLSGTRLTRATVAGVIARRVGRRLLPTRPARPEGSRRGGFGATCG